MWRDVPVVRLLARAFGVSGLLDRHLDQPGRPVLRTVPDVARVVRRAVVCEKCKVEYDPLEPVTHVCKPLTEWKCHHCGRYSTTGSRGYVTQQREAHLKFCEASQGVRCVHCNTRYGYDEITLHELRCTSMVRTLHGETIRSMTTVDDHAGWMCNKCKVGMSGEPRRVLAFMNSHVCDPANLSWEQIVRGYQRATARALAIPMPLAVGEFSLFPLREVTTKPAPSVLTTPKENNPSVGGLLRQLEQQADSISTITKLLAESQQRESELRRQLAEVQSEARRIIEERDYEWQRALKMHLATSYRPYRHLDSYIDDWRTGR